MNWLELTAGKYRVRPNAQKTSQCQLELDCRCVVVPRSPTPCVFLC
jgi:hypothetical protein